MQRERLGQQLDVFGGVGEDQRERFPLGVEFDGDGAALDHENPIRNADAVRSFVTVLPVCAIPSNFIEAMLLSLIG